MSSLPANSRRIADLRFMMDFMPRLVTPEIAPISTPDMALLADPAGLARAAAESSVRIAGAVAALGEGDDAAHAQVLWTETLAQIDRIQQLYGLPKLPFQEVTELGQLPTNFSLPSTYFPPSDGGAPVS